ncbi:ATX1 antioxidant protein 1 [Dispira simplex]|nr:ATX1 antioxidant protein 1 [Dispira simplex]
MPCTGCSGAVQKALANAEGIKDVVVDFENKTVKVTSALTQDQVLEIIRNTGKEAHPHVDVEQQAVAAN